MEKPVHARSFRDLIVYQKTKQLTKEIFEITKSFPREEMYSLTDQVRRSSRAIGAQIAEAWAKRRYERHFVSKLTDADGEQQETQHWIDTSSDCGYVGRELQDQLNLKLAEVGRMIGGMISKSSQFCNEDTLLRDSASPFYAGSNPLPGMDTESFTDH